MIHPDYYIYKAVGLVVKTIKGLVAFCTVSIEGIPVNAIALLLLAASIVTYTYSYSVKEQGVLATKTKELMSTPRGIRWFLGGAAALIGLIWSL